MDLVVNDTSLVNFVSSTILDQFLNEKHDSALINSGGVQDVLLIGHISEIFCPVIAQQQELACSEIDYAALNILQGHLRRMLQQEIGKYGNRYKNTIEFLTEQHSIELEIFSNFALLNLDRLTKVITNK
ncbi:hypothetical protein ACJX0J_039798 [Zea mays]